METKRPMGIAIIDAVCSSVDSCVYRLKDGEMGDDFLPLKERISPLKKQLAALEKKIEELKQEDKR